MILFQPSIVPFPEAVRGADLIVTGRVVNVVRIGGVRFADVAVDRTLKGTAPKRVRYLAQPTWRCDVSDAKWGERGLFLLQRALPAFADGGIKAAAAKAGPVWSLDHAGSGRIIGNRLPYNYSLDWKTTDLEGLVVRLLK